jgi:hypothetical protein
VLDALRFPGVAEHLPIAIAILVLGVITVKAIIKAWKGFLATVRDVVQVELAAHTRDEKAWRDRDQEAREAAQHEAAEWRERLEREIAGLKSAIDRVHERIDSILRDRANWKG